jgi:hypothetical protein
MTAYHNINSLEGNVKQVAQMNKEGLISTTTIPSAVITTPVVTTPTVTVASTVVPGENEQLLTSGSSKVQAFTLTLSMIVSMFAIFNYF